MTTMPAKSSEAVRQLFGKQNLITVGSIKKLSWEFTSVWREKRQALDAYIDYHTRPRLSSMNFIQ